MLAAATQGAVRLGAILVLAGCGDTVVVALLSSKDICAERESCGATCTDDFDCGLGLYCSAQGLCAVDCAPMGSPCGAGTTCTNRGRCVPAETLSPDDGTLHTGGLVPLPSGSAAQFASRACVEWRSNPDPLPTSLMLVVDVSASMNDAAGSGTTKWEVTRVALTEAIATMPNATAVGMLLFPNRDTTPSSTPLPAAACVNLDALVPVLPLSDQAMSQRNRLLSALWVPDVVQGGTPTLDAYAAALEALRQGAPQGASHMLLITDGAPTFATGCVGTGLLEDAVDEQPIVLAIAAARESGIRTFVIGAPGSERGSIDGLDSRPWLSLAAAAGGTARDGCSHDGPVYCHFDMTVEPDFAAGLSAALGQITGTIMPCEYFIPAPPPDRRLDLTNVHVAWTLDDGSEQELLRNDTEACGEGWRYTGDLTRITLCPTSCQRVRAASGSHLELFFGCTDTIVR
jgi:hypothetical protein